MSSEPSARRTDLLFVALLTLALLTSAPIWWKHAWPVLAGGAAKGHLGHNPMLYAHALGGSFMILSGAAALYVGWTRQWRRFHKAIGYSYLVLGSLGAASAVLLSINLSHPPISVGVATGTLGVVWLAFAAMAWRAAKNRRFDSHREWVVRSYVVTWTFVGCRIAQSVPVFGYLGIEGITAGIWLYWVVPILLCEIALQWQRGSPLQPRSTARRDG